MLKDRYLTAKAAADLLDISLATLYAYVSRGLIRSEIGDDKRQRRYYAEDVQKLLDRKEGRYNPEKLAKETLHWGMPLLESAITLIKDGQYYYRGQNALDLAENTSVEDVATLLWTGNTEASKRLFAGHVTAEKYEMMLLHLAMDGADLSLMETLQAFLPLAASDEPVAFDLRPTIVAQTGARILRLMVSVAAGEGPEDVPLATMLQRGWCPEEPNAENLLRMALILCADHELNVSSFAARVVASAGSTPYAAVQAGLAAMQGIKHGGYTGRVEALLREIASPENVQEMLVKRLQRGEQIPGFGHKLYPDGDPRARLLLQHIAAAYPASPAVVLAQATITSAVDLIHEHPALDLALVTLTNALHLPEGAALTLFALGRAIGWIGHAIEQYTDDELIRPRARYTGVQPNPTAAS